MPPSVPARPEADAPTSRACRSPRGDSPDAARKRDEPGRDGTPDRAERPRAAARTRTRGRRGDADDRDRPRLREPAHPVADGDVAGLGAHGEPSGCATEPRRTSDCAPPDVDDQELGADEEDDQRLDHRREVAGERRLEDARVELPRGRPDLERGEEERREEDADRLVAPEQRDGDADEADEVVSKSLVAIAELPAEEVDATRRGRRTRRRSPARGSSSCATRDAAVARRLGVEADRAHLVPERRPVEEQRVDDERGERDEDAGVERLEAPPDRPELGRVEDVVRPRERRLCGPGAGRRARRGTVPP